MVYRPSNPTSWHDLSPYPYYGEPHAGSYWQYTVRRAHSCDTGRGGGKPTRRGWYTPVTTLNVIASRPRPVDLLETDLAAETRTSAVTRDSVRFDPIRPHPEISPEVVTSHARWTRAAQLA